MARPGLSLLIMQLVEETACIYVGRIKLARNLRLKDPKSTVCLPRPFPCASSLYLQVREVVTAFATEGSATRIWVYRVRNQAILALESCVNVNKLKLKVLRELFDAWESVPW